MGGSLGRREATGRGVHDRHARGGEAPRASTSQGATVAVQGFGNVGSVSADLLAEIGAKIVAVTDWKGGVYNAKGLDIAKLLDYAAAAQDGRRLPRRRAARPTTKLFALDVDVLIPAALENQITMENAPQIRAQDRRRRRQRSDHARGAQDAARARRVRHPRHPRQLPAASRRSYFEWVQDRHGYFWEEEEVNQRLEAKMCEAFNAVLKRR